MRSHTAWHVLPQAFQANRLQIAQNLRLELRRPDGLLRPNLLEHIENDAARNGGHPIKSSYRIAPINHASDQVGER